MEFTIVNDEGNEVGSISFDPTEILLSVKDREYVVCSVTFEHPYVEGLNFGLKSVAMYAATETATKSKRISRIVNAPAPVKAKANGRSVR